MLAFMRRVNESFTIDTPDGVITVVIFSIGPSRVTLGIDAPRGFAISRDNMKNKAPSRVS